MTIRTASNDDIDAMHNVRLSVRENWLDDRESGQPDYYRALLGELGGCHDALPRRAGHAGGRSPNSGDDHGVHLT